MFMFYLLIYGIPLFFLLGSVESMRMTLHVGVWNHITFSGRSVFDRIQSDCPVDHDAVME